MAQFDNDRFAAGVKAAGELVRLGIDTQRPVDVFEVIAEQNIWLMFHPLENLFGVYRRHQDTSGILINTKRGLAVQRLTAAHEYGHHVLGHMASFDDESDIEPIVPTRLKAEAQAQAFAIDFLLPPPLVLHLWHLWNFPDTANNTTVEHVYKISAYLGSPFKSTAHQLTQLRLISTNVARQALAVPPKRIKLALGRGIGPQNPWSNIFAVDKGSSGSEIVTQESDEIAISLPENPTTGYRWTQPTLSPEASPVELVSDDYASIAQTPQDLADGMPGHRYLRLRSVKSGSANLELQLNQPWMPEESQVDSFSLNVKVMRYPLGNRTYGPSQYHHDHGAFSLASVEK